MTTNHGPFAALTPTVSHLSVSLSLPLNKAVTSSFCSAFTVWGPGRGQFLRTLPWVTGAWAQRKPVGLGTAPVSCGGVFRFLLLFCGSLHRFGSP